MKRWVLAVLVCAMAAFAVFDFVSTLPPCSLSEQKQPEQRSEEGCGYTQSFTYRMIDAGVDWIDRRHDVVTATATIVIALFTGTLWLATDKLWKAGERQMEVIRQNAADQSRDVLASVREAARSAAAMEEVAKHIAISAQAAKDSVTAVKERSAAQMRAYVSVVIGAAIYQEREKNIRFEAKPLIVNNGFTPALRVRYRAKAAILRPPIPDDFDFRLPATIAVGGSVVGSQQNSIMSAILDDHVPDGQVDSIKTGANGALHVWGIVEYVDIFGEPHETEFCQCLTWLPNGSIFGWLLPAHSNAT